jgi:hypothetical protein
MQNVNTPKISTDNQKFIFTGETRKSPCGKFDLFQIKYIRDGLYYKNDQIGGWIDEEKSLSFEPWDYSFIDDTSEVYGNSRVSNNSRVYNNSRVWNNSSVWDNSRVYNSSVNNSSVNNSIVWNYSIVDNSRVYNNSRVWNNSSVDNSSVDNSSVYNNSIVNNSIVNNSSVNNSTVTISTISLSGLTYSVTITDSKMKIGCQQHSFEAWESFTDSEIESMDGGALEWWCTYKPILTMLCKEHESNVKSKTE